ncbi:MAG: TonB-dependent receptor [Crocinitomicaceae bacterium]|nr:TonB-dependent receptor [Crocinitomicaceae bacterium]
MKRIIQINILIVSFILIFISECIAQVNIQGSVSYHNNPIEFTRVSVYPLSKHVLTNVNGAFSFSNVPLGKYIIECSAIGFKSISDTVKLSKPNDTIQLALSFIEKIMELDAVVVTGTKTYKRQTNSNVIVNVLSSEDLDMVQACSLSEGLKFQPGLRVETDCQTCNYTQLRMNGLAGGYSQILINGRPVFSPLTGLYGMEQLPVNMIDRIEVVRGGGSSLYGSSAIGGTVNVITKIPKKNNFELNYTYQNINFQTNDQVISGNGTFLSKNRKLGASLFINNRLRGFYDHNGDNFSELPMLQNTSFGLKTFFIPKYNHKIEISLSNINEYRFGGEMNRDEPAHLTAQSEERQHHVWMGGLDYQIDFKNEQTSLITYLAFQKTDRDHYTGIYPDDSLEIVSHIANPPYGISNVSTLNTGIQLNHELLHFISTGSNVFTFGSEVLFDEVYDVIPSYQYIIDQKTLNAGAFIQSDWSILPNLSLLSGVRMDKHNFVQTLVFSPRASLLYKWKKNTQLRISYGSGFRAPQAFDTDLHIAFAGGGVSRVTLSPSLIPERSKSYSASINYDKPYENFIAGFTLEGFYTRLNHAFYLQPVGEDEFGFLFEKQNGKGANIQGATLEIRFNYDRKVQFEGGFTIQSNTFDEAIEYIEGLPKLSEFVRTPNDYGFAMLSFTPNEKISGSINYVYTGKMLVPHFAGAPNQTIDEITMSDRFSELNFKFSYTINIKKPALGIEIYMGVKNIFNAYQDQFDIGKNRDSNFIYGPAQPRTVFGGIKLISL